MASDTHVYIHIPKTAGQTMFEILKRNYGRVPSYNSPGTYPGIEYLRSLSQEHRDDIRLISGHIPYGIHEILGRNVKYVTMLRHPVQRIISHYHFVRRVPKHYLYRAVVDNEMTLLDYVTSNISQELDNGQTRLLYGLDGDAIPQVREEHFQQAHINLQYNISAVGLQEEFDLSILLFQQHLGWSPPFYRSKNVNRVKKDTPAQDIIEAIESRNQYDLQLYHSARTIFHQQLLDFVPFANLRSFLFRRANFFFPLAQQLKSVLQKKDIFNNGRKS